jgi:hypothetical protein
LILGCTILRALNVESFTTTIRQRLSPLRLSLFDDKNDRDNTSYLCREERPSAASEEEDDAMSSRRGFLKTIVFAGTIAVVTVSGYAKESQAAENGLSLDSEHLLASSASATVDWQGIVQKASKKAIGSGKAGASAAVVQVCSLMWLRTAMNYQYRYGGNLQTSLSALWAEGGITRLYQGLPFALVQGPMTRFGDTAANIGVLALLETLPASQEWPLPLKTACGSAAAGLWRIVLMPIDASKTAMQVEGADGLQRLWENVAEKPGVLYRGALAQAAATAVGHFPWFLTYNFFDAQLPNQDDLLLSLARSAVLGFSASCVSDCTSNSLRVIKTTKQTAPLGDKGGVELSYPDVVKMIIEQDGVAGLLGRGLQTRILTNAIQGAAFSILWKYFQQANGV